MQASTRFSKLFRASLVALVLGCPGRLESASTQRGSAVHIRPVKEPVDYVDPNIGGIGHLLTATAPTVQLPHGMMRFAPVVTPGITDRYLADRIYGFPAGGVTLIPMTGPAETDPARLASPYDHDLETSTPYYWAGLLEKYDVHVEYTTSERAGYYRIAFPKGVPAHVLFRLRKDGEIALLSPTAISGRDSSASGKSYFYAEFSEPVAGSSRLTDVQVPPERRQPGSVGQGIIADFTPIAKAGLGIRVGTSYISVEQARLNLLDEIPRWDFDQTRTRAREAWNRELGKIRVKGGTEDQRAIFYTALYRTVCRMNDITEGGQYYSGYDNKVHSAEGRRFYVNDGLWDT